MATLGVWKQITVLYSGYAKPAHPAAAQWVEQVVLWLVIRRFGSRPPQSACRSILGQNTEPQTAPDAAPSVTII